MLHDPLTHTPHWEDHERDRLEAERDRLSVRSRQREGRFEFLLMIDALWNRAFWAEDDPSRRICFRRDFIGLDAEIERVAEECDALSNALADLDREIGELPEAA